MTIKNSTLTTIPAPIYTSVGSSAVTTAWFTNISGSTVAVNIHAVPSGFEVASNTYVHFNRSITAGDTFILDTEKFILDSGDTIQANASANASIVVTLSSVGI